MLPHYRMAPHPSHIIFAPYRLLLTPPLANPHARLDLIKPLILTGLMTTAIRARTSIRFVCPPHA